MRRIGGHVSIAGGIQNAITASVSIGGNCLQIFAGSPRLWARKPFPKNDVVGFLKLSKEKDLQPVFIHALYLVNLASDKDDLVQKSLTSLILDLQNGDSINSSGVVVHIGSHQGRGFDSVKDDLVKNLNHLLSATKNTPILLENSAGQNGKIGSLEELSFLTKNISDPRLGICLDTAHLFAGGCNYPNQEKLEDLISDLKRLELLDKVKLIHLNDSETDLGSCRDIHANLGEGKVGLQGLSLLVNHPQLSHLPLILEVPGIDGFGPDAENIKRAVKLTA